VHAAVSNGIVNFNLRAPRTAPLVQIGVALALLTAGVGAYVARWYAWLPERDDSWRTLSVGHGLLGVAFDPIGRLVAAGGWDYAVTVWDVATGREMHKLTGHTDRIYDIAFTPDGRRIASGSKDRTTRFWSAGDGRELAVVTGHRDRVMALALSPDGRSFVTGSRDSTLKLWDADHYNETKSIQPRSGFIAAVAFDPLGKSVLFGDWSGNVKLWWIDGGGIETVNATGPRVRAGALVRMVVLWHPPRAGLAEERDSSSCSMRRLSRNAPHCASIPGEPTPLRSAQTAAHWRVQVPMEPLWCGTLSSSGDSGGSSDTPTQSSRSPTVRTADFLRPRVPTELSDCGGCSTERHEEATRRKCNDYPRKRRTDFSFDPLVRRLPS
jgi:hypothetical protein